MVAFVAYARVSTEKQGASGLGLEAQEATIRSFIKAGDKLLAPVMIEIESGTRRDRPVLRQALDRCRLMGATLLVAKLDRLARDSGFVKTITRSDVPVVFCDVPASHGATGRFILGIMGEVAELEAGLIGERTKAALAAAKARGTTRDGKAIKLGGDRGFRHTAANASRYGHEGAAKARATADAAALAASMMIAEIAVTLKTPSLGGIAKALNHAGAKAPRGGAWTATAVKRVRDRVTSL